jgi:hypothetical protein
MIAQGGLPADEFNPLKNRAVATFGDRCYGVPITAPLLWRLVVSAFRKRAATWAIICPTEVDQPGGGFDVCPV